VHLAKIGGLFFSRLLVSSAPSSFHSPFRFSLFPVFGRLAVFFFCLVASQLGGGCASTVGPYSAVERSLQVGDPDEADRIITEAEAFYGSNSRLLYLMDRGMILHLAHRFQESNQFLEEADELAEDLYTRHLRNQALALLINDTKLPFRGDPYEQVMINVVKALNYAGLGDLDEALVEARRIDHRLNVLNDSVEADNYREDPFARYLTGILYESSHDLNNAFVAYEKALEAYRLAQSWSSVPVPRELKEDLLRVTELLHLDDDHEQYRQAFPDVPGQQPDASSLARLVVISYNGLAPRIEDQFIDLPISLEALALVLQVKQAARFGRRPNRGAEALLYGLQGEIVRVALPHLVSQKSDVAYETVRIMGEDTSVHEQTELVHDLTAMAKKNLDDRLPGLIVRAVARAAAKMAVAEGLGRGAGAAVDEKDQRVVQGIVSALVRILALGFEEADKRSWRTLPDEIHIAKILIPPGSYTVTLQPVGQDGRNLGSGFEHHFTLSPGETRFMTSRVMF